MISLTLPLPPIENHAYATVNGRRVKSKAAREYEALVRGRVDVEWVMGRLVALPPHPGLTLEVQLYLKHDRDVSGNKCLQDAIASALGFNDKIIRRLVVEKHIDKGNPRAEVTLSAWDGSAADTVRRAVGRT